MSDNDDINLEDTDAGAADDASSGKSGGSGFLPSLLKWVAIGLGAVVFIVTVVVVTVKIIGGSGSPQTVIPQAEDYKRERENLSWYESLGVIRTTSSDVTPSAIVVEVALGYPVDSKAVSAEITSRSLEIKDWLRVFFRMKTVADLAPQNEATLKLEIRNGINDDVLSKTKIKDVLFKQLDVVPQ